LSIELDLFAAKIAGYTFISKTVAVDCIAFEASTRERWQFGALTNRKATSSNRAPSLSSLYYY